MELRRLLMCLWFTVNPFVRYLPVLDNTLNDLIEHSFSFLQMRVLPMVVVLLIILRLETRMQVLHRIHHRLAMKDTVLLPVDMDTARRLVDMDMARVAMTATKVDINRMNLC
jgi:hypothetical protein